MAARIAAMSQHELATLAATVVFIYLGPRALEALASEITGRPSPPFPVEGGPPLMAPQFRDPLEEDGRDLVDDDVERCPHGVPVATYCADCALECGEDDDDFDDDEDDDEDLDVDPDVDVEHGGQSG